MKCTMYGGHPELTCATRGAPGGSCPCEPCELQLLRALLKRAQACVMSFLEQDPGNVEHEDPDCPQDDTCACANVADVNAVLEWPKWRRP